MGDRCYHRKSTSVAVVLRSAKTASFYSKKGCAVVSALARETEHKQLCQQDLSTVSSLDNAERNIMEEVVLPERQAVLASKKTRSTANGILRETRVPYCDYCGQRMEEDKPSIICCTCGKKLCSSDSCALQYERRHYCEDDLQVRLPLSKDGYMVLLSLIKDLNVGEIGDLTSLSNEDVRKAMGQLVSEKYVERRGLSLFSFYRVCQRGLSAWKTYSPAYRHDGIIAHFESELTNHLQEKEMTKCQEYKHSRR